MVLDGNYKADDFRNVKFFKNDTFDRVMDKNRIMNYLNDKVEGYKQQDRKAGRKINDGEFFDAVCENNERQLPEMQERT